MRSMPNVEAMIEYWRDVMRGKVLKWNDANETEKENIIHAIFDEINHEYDLNIVLETVMPIGYESANGITDISQNKIFINLQGDKKDNSIMPLFSLLHEMRHVIQYRYNEQFSQLLVRSLQYAIMYDGHAYKLVDNEWLECVLQEEQEYCKELYLLSPNEIDANKYAYNYLLNIIPEWKGKLDAILNFWLPKYLYITEEDVEFELNRIYDYIDKNAN